MYFSVPTMLPWVRVASGRWALVSVRPKTFMLAKVTRSCSPCAENADCLDGEACTVVLDEVRVPGRNLLGGKERLDERLARAREATHSGGKQPAMSTFEATRPVVAAQAVLQPV